VYVYVCVACACVRGLLRARGSVCVSVLACVRNHWVTSPMPMPALAWMPYIPCAPRAGTHSTDVRHTRQIEECTKFGEVVACVIPVPHPPSEPATPADEHIGKIFVAFKDVASASTAKEKLHGRKFDGKSVVAKVCARLRACTPPRVRENGPGQGVVYAHIAQGRHASAHARPMQRRASRASLLVHPQMRLLEAVAPACAPFFSARN